MYRRWAGAAAVGTSHCTTTSPRWPISIWTGPLPRDRRHRRWMPWRSVEDPTAGRERHAGTATMTRQPSRLSRRSLLKMGALLAAGAGTGATLSGCGGTAHASGKPLQFWSQYAPTSQQGPGLRAENDWCREAIDCRKANKDEQSEPV